MTLAEAKALQSGQWVHDNSGRFGFNHDGSPRRFRVTSVKTWKTRPQEVEVRLKWGMRQYLRLAEGEIHGLSHGDGQ